ncbi:MAG TPA: hypothetical protein VHL79_12300, partial [Ramlibacter sp.]|nr:hypothetical protein [Ramlibacter sp.]
GRVYENRDYPLGETVVSQIQVYRLQSEPERILVGTYAPIDWTTELRIVIKARKETATGFSAEAIADDIACSCFAALFANQTLGGLCQLMDPGPITWDQDEADSGVCVASLDLRVVHRTESNVIT